jgi:HSP20 family protein
VTRPRLFGPMVEITRLQSELNRLFASILEGSRATLAAAATWDPSADILENASEILVVMEVPGVAPEDLFVGVRRGVVVVRGTKRPAERPADSTKFLCMERYFGEFEKTIALPAPVNLREAVATLRAGVLTIRFPRVVDQRDKLTAIRVLFPEGMASDGRKRS